MILTNENYFSHEADREYMSVSQVKSFLPVYGGCEAAAMAKFNGEWKPEPSTAFLVGSYVHAHFEGALDTFKAEHKEIFTQKGELKSEYRQANAMINTLETDEFVMYALRGEKEVIITAEMFGVMWKAKIDRYLPGERFTDIKTVRDFEKVWDETQHARVSFIEAYGYLLQMAVYQELESRYSGRDYIDPYLVAVTKQSPPDKAIIGFYNRSFLDAHFAYLQDQIEHVIAVKTGKTKPVRCEKCEYCRATKKLYKVTDFEEL